MFSSNLYEGVVAIYGDKYKKMDVSIEDIKLICLAFAVHWDINNHGKLSQETLDILNTLED